MAGPHETTSQDRIDHGAGLKGLTDDDHTQYLNNSRHDTTTRHTLGTVVPHDSWGNITSKPTSPSLEEMAAEHEADGTHGAITPTSCSNKYTHPGTKQCSHDHAGDTLDPAGCNLKPGTWPWDSISGKPASPSLEEMSAEHEADGTHGAITPTSCSEKVPRYNLAPPEITGTSSGSGSESKYSPGDHYHGCDHWEGYGGTISDISDSPSSPGTANSQPARGDHHHYCSIYSYTGKSLMLEAIQKMGEKIIAG